MKRVGLLLTLLGPLTFLIPPVAAQQQCRVERVTYRSAGFQIVSWIMKPARDGRFPAVVWSHSARATIPQVPVVNENSPCHPFVNSGWIMFFVAARGYGGSEGPNPLATFRQLGPMAFLRTRADDVNSGVDWLKTRADVNSACIANMGYSHGGVAALLASGRNPALYRATLVQAPVAGPPGVDSALGIDEMIRAGKNITTPILVQSNGTDAVVFAEVTRVLVREFRRVGRTVEHKEYTHPSGHELFFYPDRPEVIRVWGAATAFLEQTFIGCTQ